jgi:hypothetical protein
MSSSNRFPSRDIEDVKTICSEYNTCSKEKVTQLINQSRRSEDFLTINQVKDILVFLAGKMKLSDYPASDIDIIKNALYNIKVSSNVNKLNNYILKINGNNIHLFEDNYISNILHSLLKDKDHVNYIITTKKVKGEHAMYSWHVDYTKISLNDFMSLGRPKNNDGFVEKEIPVDVGSSADNKPSAFQAIVDANFTKSPTVSVPPNTPVLPAVVPSIQLSAPPIQKRVKPNVIIYGDLTYSDLKLTDVQSFSQTYLYDIYCFAEMNKFGFSGEPKPKFLLVFKDNSDVHIAFQIGSELMRNMVYIFVSTNLKIKCLSEIIILSGGQSYIVDTYNKLLGLVDTL